MKILAFDSTALTASVALSDDERLIASYTLNNGNTHSRNLLPMAESVLLMCGISVDDVDMFACSAGPGSFTGVRIGVATVKGLAFGRGKPCMGVSTLAALAYNLRGFEGIICPVMNARRSQVYTAVFRSDGKKLSRLHEDCAISASELDGILASLGEPVRLCGDGIDVAIAGFSKTEVIPTPEEMKYQSAYSVAQTALAMYRRGVSCDDAGLVPVYLRPSQAERERNEARSGKDVQ